jgi:hypothetical protein
MRWVGVASESLAALAPSSSAGRFLPSDSREAFIYSDDSGWTSLGVLDPTDPFSQSFGNGVSEPCAY